AGALAWLLAVSLAALLAWGGELGLRPGGGAFAAAEFLGGRLLVPLGLLLGALFVGWVLPEASRRDELRLLPQPLYRAWRACLRYLAPPALLLVILAATGILGAPL
ncbi:MAG TPA: sodium-dependent transporter, partial [Gammaproteobacteria bacterium]